MREPVVKVRYYESSKDFGDYKLGPFTAVLSVSDELQTSVRMNAPTSRGACKIATMSNKTINHRVAAFRRHQRALEDAERLAAEYNREEGDEIDLAEDVNAEDNEEQSDSDQAPAPSKKKTVKKKKNAKKKPIREPLKGPERHKCTYIKVWV